jgi:hypothetical protein
LSLHDEHRTLTVPNHALRRGSDEQLLQSSLCRLTQHDEVGAARLCLGDNGGHGVAHQNLDDQAPKLLVRHLRQMRLQGGTGRRAAVVLQLFRQARLDDVQQRKRRGARALQLDCTP